MKMNKLFAGLIAFVAGVALSAGSAFATKGYTIGDMAGAKLVPYYMAGHTVFTAVAVQNMSAREASTVAANAEVMAAEDALKTAMADTTSTQAALTMAEERVAAAKEAAYTEHLLVKVMVYDAMGMEVEMEYTPELCLAEMQAGYVLFTEHDVPEQHMDDRGMVLSMDMSGIPAEGFLKLVAGSKLQSCMPTRESGLAKVRLGASDGATPPVFAEADTDTVGSRMFAAWTILQDVGTGFFGTEIPTASVTLATDDDGTTADVDESTLGLGCYGDSMVGGDTGEFNLSLTTGQAGDRYRCGLIPERHNNAMTGDPAALDLANATPRSMVTVRFDVTEGSVNDVYVWLAMGEDDMDTPGSGVRRVDVTVTCEDGMMAQVPSTDPFADEGTMMDSAVVTLPDKINVIDPMGDALMPFASQCMDAGGRGTLQFMMPSGSYAGMAWTHISQRMMNFRMNQAGYNAGNPSNCNTVTSSSTDAMVLAAAGCD